MFYYIQVHALLYIPDNVAQYAVCWWSLQILESGRVLSGSPRY